MINEKPLSLSRPLLVWLMPWAELNENLEFGTINFWDLYTTAKDKIEDDAERAVLQQFASHFKDKKGNRLQNLCIIQASDKPFDSIDDEQSQKIRWAAHAMSFSYIIRSIRDSVINPAEARQIGASERFQTISMAIDEDRFLHYAEFGAVGFSKLDGNHVTFCEPHQIVQKFDVPDRQLLQGLAAINETQFGSELWNRLKICFEWFSMAWAGSTEVSYPARYISLMTSFEALARMDEYDKAPDMATVASELCGWNEFPQKEELILDKECLLVSKPFRFVIDFAKIRNTFVHGSGLKWGLVKYRVGEQEFDQRFVMSMVIYNMVARYLLKEGVWTAECEPFIAQHRLNRVAKALHWNQEDLVKPSPHEDYPIGWNFINPQYSDFTNVTLAEEARVLRMTALVSAGPFAFFRVSTENESHTVILGSLLDDLRSHNFELMIFRASNIANGTVEYGCFVSCTNGVPDRFRNLILELTSNHQIKKAIFSDGTTWGIISINEPFESRGSFESFNSRSLRSAWSDVSERTFDLVETVTCAGAPWSQFCRNTMGLINGTELGKEAQNRLRAVMQSRFQRARAGESVFVEGETYTCVGQQLWQSGKEKPFQPSKPLIHKLTEAYCKSIRT